MLDIIAHRFRAEIPTENNEKNNHITTTLINPFKSEFTIVIFIHYKSRIAVAILDL